MYTRIILDRMHYAHTDHVFVCVSQLPMIKLLRKPFFQMGPHNKFPLPNPKVHNIHMFWSTYTRAYTKECMVVMKMVQELKGS